MKTLLILAILLFTFSNFCFKKNISAEISFKYEVLNRKNIIQGTDNFFEFPFKNTGQDTLIIESAKGNSGCVVATWPREPILPGKRNIITIKYDTNRIGNINKCVTVSTNDPIRPQIILKISGNVLESVNSNQTTNN